MIVSKYQGNKDENCAVFDKDTKECTRPRFGFSLNLDTKEITRDMIHMCAIKQNGSCLEYFNLFVP